MAASHSDRLKLAQTFLAQIGHSDTIPEGAPLAAHVTYRVHGDHVLAGEFNGLEEVEQHLNSFFQRTAGTFEAIKWEDWLVGSEHVAAVVSISVRADSRKLTGRQIFFLRFNEDDRIEDILIVPEEGPPADRFFGR